MSDPLHQLGAHFTGLWVRQETPYGQVFVGTDVTGGEVTIAVLSAAAAADPGLRNAFSDVVWRHSVKSESGNATVYAADLHAPRAWAATRTAAGAAGAEQLLTELASAPPAVPASPGTPASPGAPGQPGSPGQPGPYSPVPAGYPAGAGHPPPRGGANPWPWLLGIGGGMTVLLLLVVGSLVAVRLLGGGGDDEPGRQAGPVQVPTGAVTSPPPTDPGGQSGDPAGEPTLRPVEDVSVIGPTFGRNDETFTMAFQDWPFAFRTPLPWNCLGGDADAIPEALVWVCVGEPGDEQRMNIILWECETTCTEDEQQEMLDTWLDEPERAVSLDDSPTAFVETEGGGGELYSVDLGHFFGEQPGEPPLRWLVGVYVESPPETRDDVLKILNDVVSQTS